MNWEAISAISEAAGVVGIIISLMYVAVQIRQNSKSVRAATAHSLASSIGSFTDPFLANVDLANAWITATVDWNEVDERYKGPMLAAAYKLLHLADNIFLQHENGMIDSVQWEGWRIWVLTQMRTDSVRRVYAAKRNEFSEGFRKFIDTEELVSPNSLIADILRENSAS